MWEVKLSEIPPNLLCEEKKGGSVKVRHNDNINEYPERHNGNSTLVFGWW